MRGDNRKAMRRPLRYSAWMAFDNEKPHGCVLSDISDSGARLDVEDVNSVPERFMLLLSGTGAARRSCRVIWRGDAQIGVAFEKPVADAGKTPAAKPGVAPPPDGAKPEVTTPAPEKAETV
jgi:hypothetical protein